MSYDKDQILSRYRALKSIKAVCSETGCPPYIAYKWLKIAGALEARDATGYGSSGNRAGAMAELEFKKLVPFAMDANKHLESNCPSYDFDINGATIDVKFCSLGKSSGIYAFRTAVHKHFAPDFFVVFLADEGVTNFVAGRYRILVLPTEMMGDAGSITIQKKTGKYWDFEIQPSDLAAFFQDFIAPAAQRLAEEEAPA